MPKGSILPAMSVDFGIAGMQWLGLVANAGKFPHILQMPKMASRSMFVYSIDVKFSDNLFKNCFRYWKITWFVTRTSTLWGDRSCRCRNQLIRCLWNGTLIVHTGYGQLLARKLAHLGSFLTAWLGQVTCLDRRPSFPVLITLSRKLLPHSTLRFLFIITSLDIIKMHRTFPTDRFYLIALADF